MAPNYYIISLADGVALVPSTWLTEDQKLCYWPNKYTKSRIDSAIRNRHTPQVSKDWSLINVTKIYGSSDTFEKGLMKLKKSEWESDVDTGTDDRHIEPSKNTRHSRVIRKNSSESESDDSNIRVTTQRCSSKSSAISRSSDSLSTFPEPPKGLTVVHDRTFNDNVSSMTQQVQKQQPVVLATFESPIINEQQFEKKRLDTIDRTIDHNENTILQTESTQRKKQLSCQQSTYTRTMDPDAEFHHEVLQKLNKLMQDVKIIKETLRTLKPEKKGIESAVANFEVMKDLPLTTSEQLQEIEIKLKDDKFFQELVKMLSGLGGYDTNNITTNILKKLLSNELAEEYSFLGKKKKKPFGNLELMKVVVGTVRVHDKNITESTIAQYVGRWLVQARQRHDRELEKLQKKDVTIST